ncbi:hypothetical protein D3C72_1615400 [compost metagenome]
MGRQEQNRDGVFSSTDGLQNAPAVNIRQHHVEDDEVVGLIHCQVLAVDPVGSKIDDEARLGQALAKVLAGLRFVLHHQQLHCEPPDICTASKRANHALPAASLTRRRVSDRDITRM